MGFLNSIFKGKGWLAYGSYMGGALGALLIHINQVLPVHSSLTFGFPLGMGLAVVLGMIGGLIGGAIGCFVFGRIAKESLVLGVGESLGIGLLNGFLAGTVVGIALGSIHRWLPDIVIAANALLLILAIAVAAIMLIKSRAG